MLKNNPYLLLGGTISAFASLLHLAIILGGPDWYRFFGAGEGMALLAGRDVFQATVMTLFIALVLGVWSLYAFSGAGKIRRLPLLKPVLLFISLIFLFRGIFGVPAVLYFDSPYLNELKEKIVFMAVTSIVSGACGFFYLKGLWRLRKAGG